MTRFLTTLCAIAATLSLQASDWTLESCIDYAVSHNLQVQARQLNARDARLSVTEAKNNFLPDISGYASQSFGFGRSLTSENTYANRNTSSFSVGANLSLPIFQGLSGVRRLQYAKANLLAQLEQVEAAKDNITLAVTAAYLQALYNAELCSVARLRVELSEAELERTQTLAEAGRLPELDVYQAQAQLAQDRLSAVNAANDSITALLDLSQLLNLPASETMHIAPVDDYDLLLPDPELVYEHALASNHGIQAARLSLAAAQRNVALAKTGYIPRLNFNAGLGTNYYRTTGFDNESFKAQMRHNFAQQIGFSLSVPIFDGFGTRNQVRRANIQSENARLTFDDTSSQLYKDIVQAYTAARNAIEKRSASDLALESSQEAFRAMQTKYDAGRANATELEKARTDYTSALATRLQSKYESILRTRILMFYNR